MLKYNMTIVLCLSLFSAKIILPSEPVNKVEKKGSKPAKVYGVDRPFWTPNRIGNYITNDGQFVSHIPTGSAGMEWPLGSGNHINFASGLWLSGIKDGEIVTAAAEFVTEFQPGNVTGDAPGSPGTPADPEDSRFKVYIINQGDELEPFRNPDYRNWPVEHGAPVDENGKPLLLGTSTAWAVFNDFDQSRHDNLFSSKPMGVEVQMTAWAFDRPDAFGDMMFFKFRCINKSGTDITDAYIALWSDTDIGDARVKISSDSTRNLGYAYKTQPDGSYGEVSPAFAIDLFQGPVVPSVGDTAHVSGRKVVDHKNLEMTSLVHIVNGGPPQISDPQDAIQAYNLVQGLNNFGVPLVNPVTEEETKYWASGDPVTGQGWLMNRHDNIRFVLSSGPFTFAAGDTQEIVCGAIIGMGDSNLESVMQVRENDDMAQRLYEANFETAPPPPSPRLSVFSEENVITLNWDTLAESYDVIDRIDLDSTNSPTSFTFQGYNIYQLDSPDFSSAKQIIKIASFDLIDGVEQIRDDVFSEEFGQIVNVVVQDARDTGLQRFLRITEDKLRENAPLIQNHPYYFTVTAYGYNPFGIPRTLESRIEIVEARPQSPPLGTDLTAASVFGDVLTVSRVAGKSDGSIEPVVLVPAELTGHTYEVRFRNDNGQIVYDVVDVLTGDVKTSGFKNQNDAQGANDYPLVDGVLVKVVGPPLGFKNFEVVSNAGGPLNPPEGASADFQGFPTLRPGSRQQVGEGRWMIHTGDNGGSSGGSNRGHFEAFLERTSDGGRRWGEIIPSDYEWRFTTSGGKGYEPGFAAGPYMMDVPFELWNIGVATPDDPSDDYRICPHILDEAGDGVFNMTSYGEKGVDSPSGEHSASGGLNDPYTDWVYWYTPDDRSPGQSGYDAWVAAAAADPAAVTDGSFHEVLCKDNNMQHMVLMNWNGGQTPPFNQDLPETGTTFRITTTKPNTAADVFSFQSIGPIRNSLVLARHRAARLVNVFPNPYHRNIIDLNNPFAQFVTFTHLPEEGATIHIFTIYGDLVRKIDHTNSTQFEEWDLRNSDGRAVASGMYIVRIDMGEIGVKVLKLGVL